MALKGTVRELHINLSKPADNSIISDLLDNKTPPPELIEGDLFELRIFFYEIIATVLTRVQLGVGTDIRFGGRLKSPVGQIDLFEANTFVEVDEGGGKFHYASPVNMNTSEIFAAVADVVSARVTLNVEISDDLVTPTEKRTVVARDTNLFKDMTGAGGNPEVVDNPFFVTIDNTDSPFTFASGIPYRYIAVDLTVGAVVIDFPSAPNEGDIVKVGDEKLLLTATETITVNGNGKTLQFGGAFVSSFVFNDTHVGITASWRYNGINWKLNELADDDLTTSLIDGGTP